MDYDFDLDGDDGDGDGDEPERCDGCLLYAEWQCPTHGPAFIEMQRQDAERGAVVEALRTIVAHPDVHPSTAWAGLVTRAREVLGEMHEDG